MPFKLRNMLATLALSALYVSSACAAAPARAIVDFNAQWKFQQGDVAHAAQPALDDSAWRAVTVPHDWSIAGPVDKANPSGQGGGYFPTGVAWYRKTFSLSAKDAHRRVYVAFDGVMANSEVWINGFHLGQRPNGNVSFFYDLTGHVQFGPQAHNVLAVRCDTSLQPASRWYEGGGIYRPVRLVLLQSAHLEPWSTFVTTPVVTASRAMVHVESTVVNDSAATQHAQVEVHLIAPDGTAAGMFVLPTQTIAPGAKTRFSGECPVPNPHLWDLDHPSLYRVLVSLRSSSDLKKSDPITDDEQIPLGIREFHFDAATGFWLNGRNFKIKGVALHGDGGAVGIAVPNSIWERQLRTLRALGVNAIRPAHFPPSPQFLDLCDRMGFLVMDEMFDCWTVGKNPYDYHLFFKQWSLIDTRDTVRRDRNHPSIIVWSAGNEIHDTPHAELAHGILASLISVFHENDSTRPVTQALFRPNVSHDYDNGLADMLDVVGQNYRVNEILAAHAQKPSRKILGTENIHDRASWLALRDNPPYAGQFLWTGIDYLGEAGKWPMISRPFGLLDRTGQPHARGWERQSWWASEPVVHLVRRVGASEKAALDPGYESVPADLQEPLLHDWTPRNTTPHMESVEVYSNCEEVELFLNGDSLGRQSLHTDASPLTWNVPYAPGSLKAVAYRQGKQVAADELHTAGKPARIELVADRATLSPDADQVVILTATAVDEAGILVPDASAEVDFTVTGPAQIVATDNGNNAEHSPFPLSRRALYGGRAIAILRGTSISGKIFVRASASGLPDGVTQLTAVPENPEGITRAF
ncbi:MAG: glycoside hydrolase family 2 TIM barrel-domain containing protein [Terracidiphilus sp.]|nr:glycoside hydrolase family 2 TIM barrel-domain containing protein [Terracidiphilus sp.]MDR3776936.1 glycoside hydrolase family 2 TIM barrel-domain containing protein [Terracidiphilus sp.]